jgi:hypothetical protein
MSETFDEMKTSAAPAPMNTTTNKMMNSSKRHGVKASGGMGVSGMKGSRLNQSKRAGGVNQSKVAAASSNGSLNSNKLEVSVLIHLD